MATVTKPIALDESLNTTETPSRNVADVLAEELQNIASAIGGGGSGGHTIEGADGTALSQEPTLQFADADATDDAVNEKTVVNVVRKRTQAQYDAMSAADKAKGIIHITDADAKPLFASQVRYDSSNSVADKLDSLSTDVADTVSKSNGGTFNGGIGIDRADGTADSLGNSTLTIGNNIPQGTAGNSRGNIIVFGTGANYSRLRSNVSGGNRVNYLPDKDGTIAIEGDIFKRTTWDGTSGSGITFSNVTYMAGGYIHIGNLVHFEYRMAVTSALTANVDYTLISGLPAQFSSANVTAFDARCGRSLLIAYMLASDSTIQCTPTYNVLVNSIIVISGTYFANTYKA